MNEAARDLSKEFADLQRKYIALHEAATYCFNIVLNSSYTAAMVLAEALGTDAGRNGEPMKQISIQITDETARQIAELASRWGLPPERHNTPVVERCVERVYQQAVREKAAAK
jgi:hypothetical protein